MAGEPGSRTEGSIIIGFEHHPSVILDEEDPDYSAESDTEEYYLDSSPYVLLSYRQLDTKTGTFKKLTKYY